MTDITVLNTAPIRTYAYAKTLFWINGQRSLIELDPLHEIRLGITGDEYWCPVARSLPGASIQPHSWTPFQTNQRSALPPYVRTFIHLFDEGCYPKLILHA